MARKLTTAECVFTVIAYLNMIGTALLNVIAMRTVLDGNPLPLVFCAMLYMESVVMFKGLKHVDPSCMKLVKWLNVSKFVLIVVLLIYMKKLFPATGVENVDLFYGCILTVFITGMALSIFFACVAHPLEKFYEDLQNNRQDVVLEVVTGNGSANQSPTQGIVATKPNPVAEKAQPKDVLSQV